MASDYAFWHLSLPPVALQTGSYTCMGDTSKVLHLHQLSNYNSCTQNFCMNKFLHVIHVLQQTQHAVVFNSVYKHFLNYNTIIVVSMGIKSVSSNLSVNNKLFPHFVHALAVSQDHITPPFLSGNVCNILCITRNHYKIFTIHWISCVENFFQ